MEKNNKYATEGTDEQYDFTSILIDTSEQVTLRNHAGQTLTIKGEEVLGGDMPIWDIGCIADMNKRYVLIVLENDSAMEQELYIQSNINNRISAVINNNHNVGFINTKGNSHTATYSPEGEISVFSNGEIGGEITCSNLGLVKNTDVFGVSLSGENASSMGITVKNDTTQVYSDNLSNMNLIF